MRKKTSTDTTPFTFRLERKDRDWLEATAQANGVEVSQLVRWSIEALRQYVTHHSGKLHLPISISAYWEQIQATRPQLRAAEDPPGTDPPVQDAARRSVQFEPAPAKKRARQQ